MIRSTSVAAIGGAGYGNLPTAKCSQSPRGNIHAHLCLSPLQPRVLATLEEIPLGQRRHPQVCKHISGGISPHLPCHSHKENKRKYLTWGRKGNAKKFGPLSVVLEKIPGLFADHTVRSQTPA